MEDTWPAAIEVVTEQGFPGRDEELAKAEMATLAAMLVVTVVGNGAVLVALWASHSPRRRLLRMHLLVLHLCTADLITAAFTMLPQMAWEATYRFAREAAPLCKPLKVLQLLGPYLSSYLLVTMALDRHRAVCQPLSTKALVPRSPRRLVAIAWGLSILFSLPQAVVFSYTKVTNTEWDCWATFDPPWTEKAYVTWYSVSAFAVPLVLLLYAYVGICRVLRKNHREKTRPQETREELVNGAPPRTHSVRTISRAKIRTLRLTVVAVACYVLCSCPFLLSQLWATWYPGAVESSFWRGAAFTILSLLPCLNSCVNPWIYIAFNDEIWVALRDRVPGRIRAAVWPLFSPYAAKWSFHSHDTPSNIGSSRTRSSSDSQQPETKAILRLPSHEEERESCKLSKEEKKKIKKGAEILRGLNETACCNVKLDPSND
ncbi:vasopressin V2 receptor-like [Ischnura elegans]|uniref:vasopressin V2 receptor-like n=1 Tax=Ischnura elegans TaxID=197161 RepID=UPI001ED8694D|nr:vasopressin V2 receptor-like [Ischnura elegans]